MVRFCLCSWRIDIPNSITLASAATGMTQPRANQLPKVSKILPTHSTSISYSVLHRKIIHCHGMWDFPLDLQQCLAQLIARSPYPSNNSLLSLFVGEVSARHSSRISSFDLFISTLRSFLSLLRSIIHAHLFLTSSSLIMAHCALTCTLGPLQRTTNSHPHL